MRKEWLFTASVHEGARGGGKDMTIHMSNSKQKKEGRYLFTLYILELWKSLHQDDVGAKSFKKRKHKIVEEKSICEY